MPDIRDTISRNLRLLIAAQADKKGRLTTSRAIAAASGVSKSTVQRLIRPRTDQEWPGVDKIDSVARAFGLSAIQLLSDDFHVDDPPLLMTPEVRRELRELRLMREALRSLAEDGRPESNGKSASSGDGTDRPASGPAGGERQRV